MSEPPFELHLITTIIEVFEFGTLKKLGDQTTRRQAVGSLPI
jgi:hypothetical protein